MTFNDTNYFKGSIDDFKYWNRALTPAEMSQFCLSLSVAECHQNWQN